MGSSTQPNVFLGRDLARYFLTKENDICHIGEETITKN